MFTVIKITFHLSIIKMKTEIIKCSICGVRINDRDSHNAMPINDGRCCSACNSNAVIPMRIAMLTNPTQLMETK